MTEPSLRDRPQTTGEEIANSLSHGVGLLAGLVACPVLVLAAVRRGDAAGIVGASVFAATVIMLYAASTLYHAVPHSRAKRVLRVVDHATIFLLIAGTYTPFALGALRGAWGWSILGIVWGLGAAGVLLKLLRGVRHPVLSMTLYLGTGWLALAAAGPLLANVPIWGVLLLLAGGLAYTGGVAFYAVDHRRYAHFAWHLCVLAGTAFHLPAVLWYAG